jgi:glycosyltransferase involved in cell wall biosynthesis
MSHVKLAYVTTVPFTLGFFRGHVRYLKTRGVEVHVISSPGEALERFGAELRIAVHPAPMTRTISPAADLQSIWRLRSVLRAVQPDILHAVTPKAGLLGTLVARLTGVPIVMTSVFGLPQMTKSGVTRWLLDASTLLACRGSDRVWCDSPSMREYLAHTGLCQARKLVVLGNGSVGGVDAEGTFSPSSQNVALGRALRREHGIPNDALVVGFVGRIVRDKGMVELAQTWRTLRARFPALHLLLVGPFEPQDPLPADVNELFQRDARIHLAGEVRETAPYYAAMDLFVLPTYREGLGLVLLEAAGMELPSVATRIPGCVDAVADGVTGSLVPPRDPQALAEAMAAYLVNPELRRRHGRAGRQRVLDQFPQEAMWQALYTEYASLLRQCGLARPTMETESTSSLDIPVRRAA